MAFARKLGWSELEKIYNASLSHQIARYALTLNFELLPEAVVHQAKRCVIDALGCAISAYGAPGRQVCEEAVKELGGPEEATTFCSGLKTSALNATIVNSFLVRYLDNNDIAAGGHDSDSISALLAVSEREKRNGRDFLLSLVTVYELSGRVRESGRVRLEDVGWTSEIRAGLTMPPALGKLMSLREDQVVSAIGICASRNLPLGILDAHKEENTMAKNLRFGLGAYNAILACVLAKHGFTGPVRVIEGQNGMKDKVWQGELDLDKLTDFSGWRILKTSFKTLCADGTINPHLLATLAIVNENDLKPSDILAVRIRTTARAAEHTTTFSKKYPRNGETASHSSFYATAHAIKYRSFGPEAFDQERLSDHEILDLIEKTTVEPDPELGRYGFRGISEIHTKDGRIFTKSVDGLSQNPLTDKELEEKFIKNVSKYMKLEQARSIIDMVWKLEAIDNMSDLVQLTRLRL